MIVAIVGLFDLELTDEFIVLQKAIVETGVRDAWRRGSISMQISSYGIFPYKKKVVFAQPVMSHGWIELHQQLAEGALPRGTGRSISSAGNWVPHITLVSRLTHGEVLWANEGLLGKFTALQGKMDRLAVIDCEAERILWERML